MLLLLMTVSALLLGVSSGLKQERECYGRSLKLPDTYAPPFFYGQLYFTPSKGGSRRLLLDNGQAKDPRLKVSYISMRLTDLTERDDGIFSISFDNVTINNIIKLKIDDCAEEVRSHYGSLFDWPIPRKAEFLEYTPLSSRGQPQVLWNRTDPQTNKAGRGRMNHNSWEMYDLTQADIGFYNLRGKGNSLLERRQLFVKEYYRLYEPRVNDRLFIEYPTAIFFPLGTVTFTPKGESKPVTLREAGSLVRENNWISDTGYFEWRLKAKHDGIVIDPVDSTDSGTFNFTDPKGNLALSVKVEVEEMQEFSPTFAFVAIIVGLIFALILGCCCLRKCCCKKNSSKRSESTPQSAAAPAANYYANSQAAGPTCSAAPTSAFSYQPMNHLVSTVPTTTSLGPSAAVVDGQGAAPALSADTDFVSSDPAPKFDLKGLHLSSASPLGSDSTFCDVYTSDKLNFL
ncbi:uncharacterized protein [Trachinotus anak]|uniref:uncharacterized protein n=1 Tax=Trachinotus anak TaxID=443729 RepID=UPI0039F25FFC